MEMSFLNRNQNANLDYFEADSAERLKELILKVRVPLQILSIYSLGSKHYCWFRSEGKIKKVLKTVKQGVKNGIPS